MLLTKNIINQTNKEVCMLDLQRLQEQFIKSGGEITPVQLGVTNSKRSIYVEETEYVDLSDINLKPDYSGFYQ